MWFWLYRWLILAHSASSWHILFHPGSSWLILAHTGSLWGALAHSGSVWGALSRSESRNDLRESMVEVIGRAGTTRDIKLLWGAFGRYGERSGVPWGALGRSGACICAL